MKHNLFVLSAKRTPVGTFLGSLKNMSPTEMGVIAAQAALAESKVDPKDFSHSIFGNVCSSSGPDTPYLPRHIALKIGLPISSGAVAVNRMCGSGFEAIIQSSMHVGSGPVLCGGAESMSLVPHMARKLREGVKFMQAPVLEDSLWEALIDRFIGLSMGQTAENLAKDFSLTREEVDQWALNSHMRATKAEADGLFKNEIVPVDIGGGKIMDKDEHIRRDSTIEKLTKLKPVFGGVTTAGNASGMNDAGVALVVADEPYTKKINAKPMAKIVGSRAVGCDPKRMGIGPVAAVNGLLQELGWKMSDVDYLEINEAFAAQIVAVQKELKVAAEQLNPHGSGISLGHPLGATGARISTHICHLIASGKVRRAIGGACIGGGQGIAVAFENTSN